MRLDYYSPRPAPKEVALQTGCAVRSMACDKACWRAIGADAPGQRHRLLKFFHIPVLRHALPEGV